MNKKGWIGILTVIMLGVIISMVLYSYVRPLPWQEVMGEQQAAILNAYAVGEQARVYVEDAAHLSANRAVYKISNCSASFEDYYIKEEDCKVSKDKLEENFESEFLFYFEQYLDSFDLPSYEEDDIYTLYDVVDYDYRISIGDTLIVTGYPTIESDTLYEMDEEGELIEVEYEYESSIEIGSETYNFDYILDPYFKVEIDVSY